METGQPASKNWPGHTGSTLKRCHETKEFTRLFRRGDLRRVCSKQQRCKLSVFEEDTRGVVVRTKQEANAIITSVTVYVPAVVMVVATPMAVTITANKAYMVVRLSA